MSFFLKFSYKDINKKDIGNKVAYYLYIFKLKKNLRCKIAVSKSLIR